MRQRLLLLLLLLPLLAAAQPSPPPQGHRLHRVRRLQPVPLPPGGLVPFRDTAAGAWGLADTAGRVYVRPAFNTPVFLQEDSFVRVRYWHLEKVQPWRTRTERWHLRSRSREVWLNARGEYLLTNKRRKAYQLPDGSLHLKAWRRRFVEPEYELLYVEEAGPDFERRRNQWYRHRYRYYLGANLVSQAVPRIFWYYLHTVRGQHAPGPPPEALFALDGRRLSPYYARIGPLQEGRLRFIEAKTRREGYLDRQGREVIPARYSSTGDFRYGRAVVSVWDAQQTYRYGLIDTTGAYVWPLQRQQLAGPDEAGFIRRFVPWPGNRSVVEYLRLDGQLAFPGRHFGWGEEFAGDSAIVPDTLHRRGVLYADGRWYPRAAPQYTPAPLPTVQPAENQRLRLVKADGQPLSAATYTWAEPLAGDWFAARATPDGPMLLLMPSGQPYPLPPGVQPDWSYHSPASQEVPFADGLLKVRWGPPYQEGREPKREAYMTRGGRILTGDRSRK